MLPKMLINTVSAEEVYKNAPGRKIPPMQELREEYGRILAEKKAEFLEYAQIKKDMNEYLIAKKNLELLYQQEEEKKRKERVAISEPETHIRRMCCKSRLRICRTNALLATTTLSR